MVHVVISQKRSGADTAAEDDYSTVAFDLDAPFDEVVAALMPHRDVPGPGFLAQARRNAADRVAFLDAHGALTAEQVADFAGSSASNRRQTAHRWALEGVIFGVEHQDRILYPGFQFDPDTGRPRPRIREVLKRLPDKLNGWALALWWDTPQFDDEQWVTPIEVLDDPAPRLIRLADGEAAGWRDDDAA